MSQVAIIDTGPLVAYFIGNDTHHDWAVAQFQRLTAPFLTCEPVLTEVCFLVRGTGVRSSQVFDLVKRGALRIAFSLDEEVDAIGRLMSRYDDNGISLADACLVRMSERHPRCQVMTTDTDFLIYRRDGRRTIPLIAPFEF